MRLLDNRFMHYPTRCWDGSCKHEGRKYYRKGENSTLEGSLEKTLAFMLHRAGITYVDAFFDVREREHNGEVKGDADGAARHVKIPSPQNWTATRERRTGFAALGQLWAGTRETLEKLRPLQRQ